MSTKNISKKNDTVEAGTPNTNTIDPRIARISAMIEELLVDQRKELAVVVSKDRDMLAGSRSIRVTLSSGKVISVTVYGDMGNHFCNAITEKSRILFTIHSSYLVAHATDKKYPNKLQSKAKVELNLKLKGSDDVILGKYHENITESNGKKRKSAEAF